MSEIEVTAEELRPEDRIERVQKLFEDATAEFEREAERQKVATQEILGRISTEVIQLLGGAPAEETAEEVVEEPVVARTQGGNPPPPTLFIGLPPGIEEEEQPAVELVEEVEAEAIAETPVEAEPEVAEPVLAEPPPVVVAAAPAVDAAFEARMSGLEDAFTKLVETVTEKLDYGARIENLESSSHLLQVAVTEIAGRMEPLESKYEVLRSDLKSLEASADRFSDQVKTFDQMFASLGRDAQKMGSTIEAFAEEMRAMVPRLEAAESTNPSEELTSLQNRLSNLETGLTKAIGLLTTSEQGIAELSNLRERFAEIEAGFERVLKAVETLERTPAVPDNAAEREATANVLASLTKLVQGMRAAQQVDTKQPQ
jgi:DNA repair exonuclease SbcCD ATPase subunit